MENAFTGNDFTAYFQQIAKQHLKACMAFEADRMTGLTLTDDIVAPERDVVLEERRMHCDSDPGAQLGEAVQAALFTHHPYGIPVIGWGHEIEGLNREDALAYYRRFLYARKRHSGGGGGCRAGGSARARRGNLRQNQAARGEAGAHPPAGAADRRQPAGHGRR